LDNDDDNNNKNLLVLLYNYYYVAPADTKGSFTGKGGEDIHRCREELFSSSEILPYRIQQ